MRRSTARLMIITSAVIWGTSFPVIRFGLNYISPGLFLFLRFLTASIMLLLVARLIGETVDLSVLTNKYVAYTSILNGLGYAFQFLGQKFTYATNAAILINTSPIFTAVFAHFLLNERLSKIRIFAVFVAFIGAALMLIPQSKNSLSFGSLGDLLCLVAGLVWGLYVAESKKLVGGQYKPMDLLFSWFVYTSFIGFIISIFEGSSLEMSISLVFVLIYVALFCTILAFLLWFKSLEVLEASTSSAYFMLEIFTCVI